MPEGQVLEFSGVTKRYGPVTAVDDFTVRIEPGVVTGFLGPNGAGKTTSLRVLLGLVKPSAGTATIGGQAYRSLSDPMRTVGAVLEATSFHPGRTARDHLKVYAQAGRIPLARVDEVLELVGLAEAARRKVGGYSLGMRQRLALATALLGDPSVLVLDEPTNGLDPEGISWMRSFLRTLAAEGRTVLMSSHLLSEVQQTADALVMISHGRLVFQGGFDDLLIDGDDTVVVDAPDRAALTAALSAAGIGSTLLRSGFTVRGSSTIAVGAAAAAAGVALSSLGRRGPSLEDVFFQLVNGERVHPSANPAAVAAATALAETNANAAQAAAGAAAVVTAGAVAGAATGPVLLPSAVADEHSSTADADAAVGTATPGSGAITPPAGDVDAFAAPESTPVTDRNAEELATDDTPDAAEAPLATDVTVPAEEIPVPVDEIPVPAEEIQVPAADPLPERDGLVVAAAAMPVSETDAEAENGSDGDADRAADAGDAAPHDHTAATTESLETDAPAEDDTDAASVKASVEDERASVVADDVPADASESTDADYGDVPRAHSAFSSPFDEHEPPVRLSTGDSPWWIPADIPAPVGTVSTVPGANDDAPAASSAPADGETEENAAWWRPAEADVSTDAPTAALPVIDDPAAAAATTSGNGEAAPAPTPAIFRPGAALAARTPDAMWAPPASDEPTAAWTPPAPPRTESDNLFEVAATGEIAVIRTGAIPVIDTDATATEATAIEAIDTDATDTEAIDTGATDADATDTLDADPANTDDEGGVR